MRWCVLAAILVTACRGGTSPSAAPDAAHVSPVSQPSASTSPSTNAPLAPTAMGVTATPTGDAEPAVAVIISRTKIIVDDEVVVTLDEPRANGVAAKYRRSEASDLLVVPLVEPFKRAREADKKRQVAARRPDDFSDAAIIADPTTPQRIVLEVLFTLGQCGFLRTHFMVLQKAVGGDAGATSRPPAPLPPTAPLPPLPADVVAPKKSLDLHVDVDDRGFSLKTSGGAIGPGCRALGAGVTIPKRNGAYDFGGLTACARAAKSARPDLDAEVSAIITSINAVEYGTVIGVMDALRRDGDRELFPEITFGTTRP